MLVLLLLTVASCQLTYVAELFRHGARYTLHKFYDYNQTYANRGQSTMVGMRQQYNLGRYLRRDYIINNKFLNDTFDQNQMEILAAPGNRIYVSAYSQLAGLYPAGTGAPLPDGIDPGLLQPPYTTQVDHQDDDGGLPNRAQPIPVHDGSPYLDDCPRHTDFEAQMLIQHQLQYQRMNIEYFPFFERMQKMFKIADYEMNVLSMSLLYDVLAADKYLGRPLPVEFTDEDFQNLRHLTHYMIALVWSGQYSKILSTPLFQKIISDFDYSLANPDSPKRWTMFSGHDTNVAPTSWYLNISSASCIEDLWKDRSTSGYLNCEVGPDFGANLMIELYRAPKPYIKILYNGKYMNVCGRKSTECEYAEWKGRIEAHYVDYKRLCGIKTNLLSE